MNLQISDYIQIASLFLGLLFGVIGTFLAQFLTRKRRKILWSLVSESDFLSTGIQEHIDTQFRVPVKLLVNGIEQQNASVVRIKIANGGNVEIQDLTIYFSFGPDSSVNVGRYIGDLGAFRNALELEKSANSATLSVTHINKGQSFEVEFLVGNYSKGSIYVDMSKAGVSIEKITALKMEQGLSFMGSIGLSLIGVNYNPVASQTSNLVAETRLLRHAIENIARNLSEKRSNCAENSNNHAANQ